MSGLKQQYIATQLPLTDTVEDFWQMVKYHRCLAVVYVKGNVKYHKVHKLFLEIIVPINVALGHVNITGIGLYRL